MFPVVCEPRATTNPFSPPPPRPPQSRRSPVGWRHRRHDARGTQMFGGQRPIGGTGHNNRGGGAAGSRPPGARGGGRGRSFRGQSKRSKKKNNTERGIGNCNRNAVTPNPSTQRRRGGPSRKSSPGRIGGIGIGAQAAQAARGGGGGNVALPARDNEGWGVNGRHCFLAYITQHTNSTSWVNHGSKGGKDGGTRGRL